MKKFNPHIGLSFVHLIVVMAIMAIFIDAPQPWRGILLLALLLSLVVWPWRFIVNWAKEEFKKRQWAR